MNAVGKIKTDSAWHGWMVGFMSGDNNQSYSITVKNDTTIGWIKVQWMCGKDTLRMASDSGRYIKVKL